MKIRNKSEHPTRKLRPLIEFVRRRSPKSFMTNLRLFDEPSDITSWGLATKYDIPRTLIPSVIEVFLRRTSDGDRFEYPYKNQYFFKGRRAAGPPIQLRSWEEEVILVLGHEFGHIDWWWQGGSDNPRDAFKSEVFAEAHGQRCLRDYRREQRARKRLAKELVGEYCRPTTTETPEK